VKDTTDASDIIFDPRDYNFYAKAERFVYKRNQKDQTGKKKLSEADRFKEVPLLTAAAGAVGVAIKKAYIGTGAERVAYNMTEIDTSNKPVGLPLVAKYSKLDEGDGDLQFHLTRGQTQNQARRLSKKCKCYLTYTTLLQASE
jgi:hypothetical protein